ncbi:Uncharacterized protein APZ42_008478 [Daphnia magna]|uniref:Uncharacterized protein n=2 Tax=Daphnia magna TaxID=35525 RepID=A0ABR0B2Z1_9CRUS|nr:hypothetical protein OUZ56_028087 [Daphnia magna]KZR96919.1 Uncharacterized protein APZ42_008478 [Daphnia magna]
MVIKLPPPCIVLYSIYPKSICQPTYLPGCNEEESLVENEEVNMVIRHPPPCTVLYSFYVKTICQLTCLSGCNEEEPLESKLLNGDAILCVPFEISFFTFL